MGVPGAVVGFGCAAKGDTIGAGLTVERKPEVPLRLTLLELHAEGERGQRGYRGPHLPAILQTCQKAVAYVIRITVFCHAIIYHENSQKMFQLSDHSRAALYAYISFRKHDWHWNGFPRSLKSARHDRTLIKVKTQKPGIFAFRFWKFLFEKASIN